jgi:hypothetical protein
MFCSNSTELSSRIADNHAQILRSVVVCNNVLKI